MLRIIRIKRRAVNKKLLLTLIIMLKESADSECDDFKYIYVKDFKLMASKLGIDVVDCQLECLPTALKEYSIYSSPLP